MPIVVLDDEIEGVEHDAVIIDQQQGAQAMMDHLLADCGAQRVFFVGGVETNIDTQARYKAYRDSLKKAGLKFNKEDVFHLDYTYESAYRLARGERDELGWAEAFCVCGERRNGGGYHCRSEREGCGGAEAVGGRRVRRHARGANDSAAADDRACADVEDGGDGDRAAVPADCGAGAAAAKGFA